MGKKLGKLSAPLDGMEPTSYAYHQGRIRPYEEAALPLDSPCVLDAFVVFGLMMACWNEAHEQLYIHRLDQHCRRLRESMKSAVIVDLRNVYSPDRMREQGFHYTSVGR